MIRGQISKLWLFDAMCTIEFPLTVHGQVDDSDTLGEMDLEPNRREVHDYCRHANFVGGGPVAFCGRLRAARVITNEQVMTTFVELVRHLWGVLVLSRVVATGVLGLKKLLETT